jgi:hypothetical protein
VAGPCKTECAKSGHGRSIVRRMSRDPDSSTQPEQFRIMTRCLMMMQRILAVTDSATEKKMDIPSPASVTSTPTS